MERSGGLKKYEGSAYSDKDLEDFLRSCGDDKVWAHHGMLGQGTRKLWSTKYCCLPPNKKAEWDTDCI